MSTPPSSPRPPAGAGGAAGDSLRNRGWRRFLRGPDPALLDDLYVPALSIATRYDRCCAYFSSSVLAAAARGFGRLIQRLHDLGDAAPRPAIRLVVNEELVQADVNALLETGDTTKLERLLDERLADPVDLLTRERLEMLAWLVKEGLLQVRVGVMRHGAGIVHAKFGIVTDANDDAIVFAGSGNESAQGLLGNYERLEVSTSWDDPERHREHVDEFAALWRDRHPDVHTLPLPKAIEARLIRFAPHERPVVEPADDRARQRAAMIWRFLVEAPYSIYGWPGSGHVGGATCDSTALVEMWPHQRRVVRDAAEAWPAGRLLCDEVGMGKTVEAILALRRLMAGQGVGRALLLVPAGLTKQWQGELREKGGLVVPRMEGAGALVWPDERVEHVGGLAQGLEQDLLIVSREMARTEQNRAILMAARPWDLVLLDESHAARRRGTSETEPNAATLLLALLRELQLRRKARGLMLLSATPMQTQPWEPWDLLAVLGEGGAWLADFRSVRDVYHAAAAVSTGTLSLPNAQRAARVLAADDAFPPLPDESLDVGSPSAVARRLAFTPALARERTVRWLRQGSPLGRRMHRNTRATLREYYTRGLLDRPPPVRDIRDVEFDFEDAAEREVYESIGRYIDARFEELEREQAGKGFVMTIYRRRASSSPHALARSLERRREGLVRVANQQAQGNFLDRADEPEALADEDLPDDDDPQPISSALPTSPAAARAELRELDRLLDKLRALEGQDSKLDRFFTELDRATSDGRAALVFSEYADTMIYLRDALYGRYGGSVGSYSGDGGAIWDGSHWQTVTKDAITRRLRERTLKVLVCTDAASEGLNLQAAGAIINYDLPWNPSKVEQRIGRIDRIGQPLDQVRVVNLFLRDSIDQRVYQVLRQRCGLFEHFVGAMQPVLARARRMLRGQEPADAQALAADAAQTSADQLALATYRDSEVGEGEAAASDIKPAYRLADLARELRRLDGVQTPTGPLSVRPLPGDEDFLLLTWPDGSMTMFATTSATLEHDRVAVPLSPFAAEVRRLADLLERPGERLPLVIGGYADGAFRAVDAMWFDGDGMRNVRSLAQLRGLLAGWDDWLPNPGDWQTRQEQCRYEAKVRVVNRQGSAARAEARGLERQLEAARLRLLAERGRFLFCLEPDTGDLNQTLWRGMQATGGRAARLRQCFDRLGQTYPTWDPDLVDDLRSEMLGQPSGRREARLLGSELDAALQDPRWLAAVDAAASPTLPPGVDQP